MATEGTFEAKFYGLGADGTVGANKNSIKIIGENTNKYCQAYFSYDSKKSGGFTCSHLRFGDNVIRSPYLVTTPDFVACHVFNYMNMYEVLKGIKQNGTFLLNSMFSAEETVERLSAKVKKELAEKNISFYIINATKIAEEIGLGNRTNTILQSAFFKIAEVIPYELAVKAMKKAIDKSYGKKGENVLAVRVDNSWTYRERATNSRYQWNNKNFNANYGGIPKNVWLHVTGTVYQTLPLYSNLGTTGTYIYGSDFDIPAHKMQLNVEAEVKNDGKAPRTFNLHTELIDADGKTVAYMDGNSVTLKPGEKTIVTADGMLSNVHFWSWGYGYLYTVKTFLVDNTGKEIDEVVTRTGFRKTKFAEGKVWLNDRVIMMHGYAQRTSNEWPYVGMSVPAWLSDYSNNLQVESGGNLVRWMHVTPWKQDIESCDRVGLIQAMPAGDAEKDVEGRRWEQRALLMRDAIIYNRNNPSILFYEGGNESIAE